MFSGAMEHPLHIHINPFQLIDLPLPADLKPGTAFTSWFKPGDRYDTLQMPMLLDETIPYHVRIQPGPYAGYAWLHCHVRGMGEAAALLLHGGSSGRLLQQAAVGRRLHAAAEAATGSGGCGLQQAAAGSSVAAAAACGRGAVLRWPLP